MTQMETVAATMMMMMMMMMLTKKITLRVRLFFSKKKSLVAFVYCFHSVLFQMVKLKVGV